MRENDGIFESQRIMLHLFSQNAARESNFTSCRHCTKALQKFCDKDTWTCSNWYTAEGHIGQGSVSHPFKLEFRCRYL